MVVVVAVDLAIVIVKGREGSENIGKCYTRDEMPVPTIKSIVGADLLVPNRVIKIRLSTTVIFKPIVPCPFL